MSSLPAIARPAGAHARPTGEAYPSIDDQDPSVIAMIDALDGERIERVKQGEATPGVLHEAPILAGHLIRAHGVEEDVDADARPAALGERRRHLPRDGAVFIDEVGERDRRPSLTDRRQHGREDLVSVQEEPGAVALGGARQGMGFERPREGRLAHAHVRRDIAGMTQGAAGQGEVPGEGKSEAQRFFVPTQRARE